MTSEQRSQIRGMSRRPVGSIWGYWPFLFPVLIVIIGVAVQIALLVYLKGRVGDFDILIRHGGKVQVLWDSQLVRQAVLTVSFSITMTFGLLAFLAWRSHKQAMLLKAAASELGIEDSQPDGTARRPAQGINPGSSPKSNR
jgi:hypothetical protein